MALHLAADIEINTTVELTLMNPETLGERLRQARDQAGLTQKQLGQAAGVSEAAISMWESGKTKNIRAESLNKAAQRLRVSPDWLLSGADDPPCTKDCGEIAAHWTLLTASQRDKLETMAREWAEENAAVLRELR